MAKKLESNFENYVDKIGRLKMASMSRRNLPIPDHEEILDELVAEGMKLLEEDEKLQKKSIISETKKLESSLGLTSPNPYVRARMEILSKMSNDKRKVIEEMENGTKPKDHRYDEFVRLVAQLGDKMTS